MLLLHSSTDDNYFLHKIDQPLSYNSLVFRISGVWDATAFDIFDIGRVRFTIRNKPVIDADFDMLAYWNDIIMGSPEITAKVVSTPFAFTIVIPRFWLDDNIESVIKEDNATFEINFGPNVANNTSFLAELYVLPDEGLQTYNLRIIQQEDSLASQGTFKNSISSVENIAALYLTDRLAAGDLDADSLLSRYYGNLGPNQFNSSIGAALAVTRQKNQIEDVTFDQLIEVFAAEIGDMNAKLNDAVDITLQCTAACNPQFLLCGLDFNPNKVVETSTKLANRFQALMQQKAQQGKTRTVSTLQALAAFARNVKGS